MLFFVASNYHTHANDVLLDREKYYFKFTEREGSD